ncbi:hypothetical protein RclHR1_12430004 [Rhizophagus clarus]|uniref:K Homology domain-containing protein n=1 Tax=Rhizophagus clarus TaxID=94130 RepID=A0A2Z6Q8W4_9GLOM|nr:hypothetical protein RclHR1_12430004 [Rhizophagus clarus]GES84476.1 hypothetical protein GLOIN_2v1885406 [Rhizophagus clarus]
METEVQNSIRYSPILTIIEIPNDIVIGQLIGRKGRNLNPIKDETGTHIRVIDDDTNPTQIEIEINKNKVGNNLPVNRIDEAIYQINKLLEDIEINNRRRETEKEEKNARISNNGNYQHASPRNYEDNDLKEERRKFNQKIPHTTRTRQSRNKDEEGRSGTGGRGSRGKGGRNLRGPGVGGRLNERREMNEK